MNSDQSADNADSHSTESAESQRGHREKAYQSTAQMGGRQNLDDGLR
jgi:hypothetical protein